MFGGTGALAKTFGRAALKLDASSPTLLFGAGVVGMIGSTVLACNATLKVEKVLDQVEKDRMKVEHFTPRDDQDYTEKDRENDIRIIKVKGAVKLVKLYAPAVGLGIVSVAALTKSHQILNQRNVALMAAYAALEKGFDEYRRRVVEKYGEDQDAYFRYGSREVDIIEDGKKKTVTRVGSDAPTVYARFFDQTCTSWSKEPEYNKVFLNAQQSYANNLLHARGHVFLNEVYDMLGMRRSRAGSIVGWIITDENENFIDFNIFNGTSQASRDFVNGIEGAILLDFNVDGVIWDLLKRNKHEEKLSWQLSN